MSSETIRKEQKLSPDGGYLWGGGRECNARGTHRRFLRFWKYTF